MAENIRLYSIYGMSFRQCRTKNLPPPEKAQRVNKSFFNNTNRRYENVIVKIL